MSPSRVPSSELLTQTPVVAVLRAGHASEYLPVIEALVEGGLTSIELTLSTAGVFERFEAIAERFVGAAEIGVGTVTAVAEAERAIDAGARFVVTPTLAPDVVALCVRRSVPVFPGAFSPTEIHTGWVAGATAVKVFPASVVGPDYLRQLLGPFPDLRVIPSGGLDTAGCREWISAGAAAVSVGGPLIQDAFRGGDLIALRQRTRELVDVVTEAAEQSRGTTS